MSKNSNNVIFTRLQIIGEAKARLRVGNFPNLSFNQKSAVNQYIEMIGTEVFNHCKHFANPEQIYVEELRRIEREGSVVEFMAANLLLESALWLIKIKYEYLKEILGE